MSNTKKYVLERFPDARIVYGSSNKPMVMSDDFLYTSKPGISVDDAWDKALTDITGLNFDKRFFTDKEIVKYYYPEAYPFERNRNEWVINDICIVYPSPSSSIDEAWVNAAKFVKENYKFWAKKDWGHE